MNREEKIQLIKEVKAGNIKKLKEIAEERRTEEITNEYFYPCFFYLSENEIIVPNTKFGDNVQVKIETLSEIKQGLEDQLKTGSLERITDAALEAIIQIFDSLRQLRLEGKLKILDPYKKIADEQAG